jgi:hypothetical protein
MDVVVWLRGLGLGKYEAIFRENDIDETVLPSLTEEHLKQLGVTSLGHRVKLLEAIAALRDDLEANLADQLMATQKTCVTIRRAQWPTVQGLPCPGWLVIALRAK